MFFGSTPGREFKHWLHLKKIAMLLLGYFKSGYEKKSEIIFKDNPRALTQGQPRKRYTKIYIELKLKAYNMLNLYNDFFVHLYSRHPCDA